MAITGGSTKDSASVYYNLNAGDPNRWLYSPDVSRREYSDRTFENASARLTWQATPRSKVSGFWDAQSLCRTCTGATAGQPEPARVSPEAVGVLARRLDVTQATWSSPIEPADCRGRLQRHLLRRRQLRARPQSDTGSHSRGGTVRERMRRERQYSRAGLSIAGLQRGAHRFLSVEGIDRLRHRHA